MDTFEVETILANARDRMDWDTIVNYYKDVAITAGIRDKEFWQEFDKLAGFITPVTANMILPVGTPITNTERLIVKLLRDYKLL